MNFGGPSASGSAEGLRSGVFLSADAVGMEVDDPAIETAVLDFDPHELLMVQLLEPPIRSARLRPKIHAAANREPVAEALRMRPPSAAGLREVQDSANDWEVSEENDTAL